MHVLPVSLKSEINLRNLGRRQYGLGKCIAWFLMVQVNNNAQIQVKIAMLFLPNIFLAATVCPSVPSFSPCSNPIIVSSWNFKELLPMTELRSMLKVKVKITEVKTLLSRFCTVTPVQKFTFDDEMMHKAWCCLGEVDYSFSRSSVNFQGHAAIFFFFYQIGRFRTVTPVWIHQWLRNYAQSLK